MEGKKFIVESYLIGLCALLSGQATPSYALSFSSPEPEVAYATSSSIHNGENAPHYFLKAPKVQITPATIPDGKYGSVYKDQKLKVTGGSKDPYTFSVAAGSLPPGINLSGDGNISGTPSAAGTFSFTVMAIPTGPPSPGAGSGPGGGQGGGPGPGNNGNDDKENADSGSADYTLVVGQAALTITASNAGITYGSALPALTVSYSGFVNGDDASRLTTPPSTKTAATSASPAGAYPITASGALDSNYSFAYKPGTLTINPAAMAVTANAQVKDFGTADPAFTYTASGFVNGDNTQVFTGKLSRFPGELIGIYPITKGSLSAGRNYTINFTGSTLTISALAKLRITPATLPNAQYGTAYKYQNLKVTGGKGAYSFTVSSGSLPPGISLTSDGTMSGTPTAAGTYSFTVTAAGTGSVSQDYTLVIDKVRLTITANNATITYGGAIPTLTVSYSGFVTGDDVSKLSTPASPTTSATTSSAAGAYPITVSGAVDPNYNFVYNAGTLTINTATLVVTANALKKDYGTADPALTYTASGYVNGNSTEIFSGSLRRSPGEAVGAYPITRGSLGAGRNYTINFTGSTFTISVAAQQIAWTQSLLVGCNTTKNLQLTASASSGLPVTYSISDASIATISGNVLTLLHPGTAVVTATQPGDANHAAAQPVSDTLLYQSASLITQHWNDALIFDNSSGSFVQWQWYKNGQAVQGATSPFYSETPSLNGQYYVIAMNASGQQIKSCILTLVGDTVVTPGIKVRPNPVNAGGVINVTNNYTASALQGAILQVVDLNGKVWQQITPVQPTMQVTMPSEHGIYIMKLMLGNGQKASTNVLVLN